jgi:endonuclease YncB( thermonuclease family)
MFNLCFPDKKTTILSNSIINDIQTFEYENSIPFTFPIEYAKCISVYDGDTFTILFKLPNNNIIYRHNVRLNGLDCPEMRTTNLEEKEIAIKAKTEIEKIILNNVIKLKNVKNEKFGRILADVYFNGICVNEYLINKRLAVKYDGKTKIIPSSWKKYYEDGELM